MKLSNIIPIDIDSIRVEGRLRGVRESFVENLILMAEDTGITTPIHVRKVAGSYVLIDGAHRLEAARRLGLPQIAAIVVECRADQARAMEASNNLGAARMTPLQTAVFVAAWKREYYVLHPDRKQGVFKGNRHTGVLVTDNLSVTRTIADAFGCEERTIYRALEAGEKLSPEEVNQLENAPGRITMEDLRTLAKVNDPKARKMAVSSMAEGRAKNAAAAVRALKSGPETPVKDPVQDQFLALKTAWKRAGAVARRRFIAEFFDDLSEPVCLEAADRDEAEVAALRASLPGVAAE